MNRLKDLRTKHKLTLEKLSSQLEIPINTLSRYERGEREPIFFGYGMKLTSLLMK